MENILKLEKLNKKFGKKQILKEICCELNSGIYGLLGPNGAGKTTLMRCITGLYRFHGDVSLNGQKIQKINSNEIGYLPQQFGLFPELTVYEMLEYMCNVKKIGRKERKQTIENCIEMVNLSEKRNERVRKISGGMKRRLGIAQALLADPKVIIFDEPTAGLDPEERMRFKNIVSMLSKDKIIIISTHIVEDVEAICDHIIVIDQGEILKIGTISDIKDVANQRIIETNNPNDKEILYIEKSYEEKGEILYRAISKNKRRECLKATVEDGYLCLLKEK